MRRSLLAAFLLLSCAGSSPAQAPGKAPAPSQLKRLIEARPVHVDQPVSIWKNGKLVTTSEAVLLRVEVENIYDFTPTDSQPPQIAYGRSICRVVVSPLSDGVAVLLAAPLEPGEPSTLSVLPPIPPNKIEQRHLDLAARHPELTVPKMDPALRKAYPDLQSLRNEALAAKRRRS